jgi:primase-polymerase (primpol)-like protein
MQAEEFKQAFCFLAELCDKLPPSDKKIQWFFKACSIVPEIELKRALNVFGSRAKWPSLKEILYECGISAPMTRDERDKMNAKNEGAVEQVDSPEHHKNSYGFWCFLSEYVTNSEQEALSVFEQKTKGLESLGWYVHKKQDYWVKKEIEAGNQTHTKAARCRMNWAFRFQGEPDPARDATIARILRSIPCVTN